jgi:16S rRNA (guanine966-N2)-methyltransferase
VRPRPRSGSGLRVIAGSLKGRRLKTPTWAGLRPTSDTLRETLFNVLAGRVAGARVLDGYAGTGALGIEALSRGARSVTFVDRDRRARALIAENLALCGIERGYAIIRSSFGRLGPSSSSGPFEPFGEPFGLILLDPPYEDLPEQAASGAAGLLAPGGVLVLEHAKRQIAPDVTSELRRTRQIVSGDSVLSFYERPEIPTFLRGGGPRTNLMS